VLSVPRWGHVSLSLTSFMTTSDDFHRESSLYLPCRFSQPSDNFLGDVPFPQDGPPKFTQLSTQIEKNSQICDSCSTNVEVMKNGLRFDGFRRVAAFSQWAKRAQGHFSRYRQRSGPCPAALRAPVVAPRPYRPASNRGPSIRRGAHLFCVW